MSVGLDIGSRTIKVVELSGGGGKYKLKSAGAVAHSNADIAEMKDDKELSSIAQIIKKLYNDAKIGSKDVAICLPETQVYTRMLKFPLLNDQEIASAVKWEAEEYIPIPITEAVIEHQILERREAASPPQVLVSLVAVHRDLVNKYIKVCEMAGLSVVGVETELISTVRSTAPNSGTIMVVDFGAKSTDMAIAQNKVLYFSRSVPTAGDAFTRAVAQSLGVSAEQAEQYKRTYGLSEDQLEGKVYRSISPIIKSVVEEIKKANHYYQLEVKGQMPSSIALSGGSAGLPNITGVLANQLGIEVEIANPFSQVELDSNAAKDLANYAPIYTAAVGLAMRED